MTLREIEVLDGLMIDAQREEAEKEGRTLSQVDIIDIKVCNSFDPDVAWRFICYFQKRGLPLPIAVTNTKLLRIGWLSDENYRDPEAIGALSLRHPVSHHITGMLHAFAIIRDLPLERVAEMVNLPLEVIELYLEIFWNVRPRWDDLPFMSNLVYPDGIRETLQPNYLTNVSTATLQLRLAWHYQDPDLVIRAAGPIPKGSKRSVAEMCQEMERSIMEQAHLLTIMGGLNQSNLPGIKHATELICAGKKSRANKPDSDSVMGLGAIASLPGDIMDGVARVTSKRSQPSNR